MDKRQKAKLIKIRTLFGQDNWKDYIPHALSVFETLTEEEQDKYDSLSFGAMYGIRGATRKIDIFNLSNGVKVLEEYQDNLSPEEDEKFRKSIISRVNVLL